MSISSMSRTGWFTAGSWHSQVLHNVGVLDVPEVVALLIEPLLEVLGGWVIMKDVMKDLCRARELTTLGSVDSSKGTTTQHRGIADDLVEQVILSHKRLAVFNHD